MKATDFKVGDSVRVKDHLRGKYPRNVRGFFKKAQGRVERIWAPCPKTIGASFEGVAVEFLLPGHKFHGKKFTYAPHQLEKVNDQGTD